MISVTPEIKKYDMCQITSGDHRAPKAGLNVMKNEVKSFSSFHSVFC